MLTFYGETSSGRVELTSAVSIEINRELGVPADDMSVKFCGFDIDEPLCEIIAEDGGKVCFRGIVDEQITGFDSRGSFVTVYARSPAALPLDSECESGTYTDPSLDMMIKRHLAPFGIAHFGESVRSKGGTMSIAKGQSHYAAVRKFCTVFYGTIPRIDSIGIFRTNAYIEGEPIIFGENGIGYTAYRRRVRRCSLISRVYVGTASGGVVINDSEAARMGVVRERRIDLLDSRTGTLCDADDIIKRGRSGALEVQLECPCDVGDIIGRNAEIRGGRLRVVKTKFTFGAGVKKTVVTLAPEKEAL